MRILSLLIFLVGCGGTGFDPVDHLGEDPETLVTLEVGLARAIVVTHNGYDVDRDCPTTVISHQPTVLRIDETATYGTFLLVGESVGSASFTIDVEGDVATFAAEVIVR